MTKPSDLLFLNLNTPDDIQGVSPGVIPADLTGEGGTGMHKAPYIPADLDYEAPQNTTLKAQNAPAAALGVQPGYDKDKRHISTQRYRLARLIIGQSKKEFAVLKQAFEVLAQTPTGRAAVLTIPESTSYAVAKLPLLAQMLGSKRQIIFSDDTDLYKKPLAQTLDTIGHEYTHLVNFQNVYHVDFEETEADFFMIKMLDEITARMQASQIVHEARQMKLLPRKLGSRPMSVAEAYWETIDIGYSDLFVQTICENRHISPFLLAQMQPEHSEHFRQSALPYFLSAYPALNVEGLIKNIEYLYQTSLKKRVHELCESGCKLPPQMAAALRRGQSR